MDTTDPVPPGAAVPDAPVAVDVYWRPGCGYCSMLARALSHAGVAVRPYNIWEDDEARAFVRSHNRGNETVPTVAVGTHVFPNPNPARLIEFLRAEHPALVTVDATDQR
jgi:mycoredoxin